MKVNMDTRVARSNEPITAAAGNELIMLSVEQGRYYGFNEIAAAIWQRIEAPVAVSGLCAQLQRDFDVPAQRCEAEVIEFLQMLAAKGLLKVVG